MDMKAPAGCNSVRIEGKVTLNLEKSNLTSKLSHVLHKPGFVSKNILGVLTSSLFWCLF